jgi:hypothetical protein
MAFLLGFVLYLHLASWGMNGWRFWLFLQTLSWHGMAWHG